MLVLNSLSITCLIISWNVSSNCKKSKKAHYHLNCVQSFILFFLKDINQLRERKKERTEKGRKSQMQEGEGVGGRKGKKKLNHTQEHVGLKVR